MTEIKKLTKIALIVLAIVTFIFGINLTFLYDMTMNPEVKKSIIYQKK